MGKGMHEKMNRRGFLSAVTTAAGDIVNIPVGTPHQMDFKPGESVTYVMVKIIEPKDN